MTEAELLRLPEIPEGTPEEQLKAVKLYLCRLAEQLEYILTTERQERLRGQEETKKLEDRLASSPKVAEGLLNASARRFGSQYVEIQDYERDRAKREAFAWENRDRLNEPAREASGKSETEAEQREEIPTLLQEHGGRWQVS